MAEYDPTDLVAEEKRKAAEEEEAKYLEASEKSDFLWLMDNPRGRRVMWGLLSAAKLFTDTSATEMDVLVEKGRRQIGLRYLNMLFEHCPDKFQLMVTEQQNGKRKRHKSKRG